MFDIDFQRIAYNLIPHFLRGTKMLEWMYSLVRPLRVLNIRFQAFRANQLYMLYFNGQTIYLERVLNDQFDPIGRGIFIDDTANIDFDYLFQAAEQNTEVFLYNNSEATPFYFQNKSEYDNLIDFIVKIPISVTFDPNGVNALVNKYKQAGKRHSIETF